jgi:hypothetical protein
MFAPCPQSHTLHRSGVRSLRKRSLELFQNHFARKCIRILALMTAWIIPVASSNTKDLFNPVEKCAYFRAIQLPDTIHSGTVFMELDDGFYERGRGNLNSLRILDANGTIIPHGFFRNYKPARNTPVPARILTTGIESGESFVELELESPGAFHNRIILNTGSKNFIRRATVICSNDQIAWEVLQENALIFSFSDDSLNRCLTISYSQSESRYLRVIIEPGDPPVEVSGIAVHYQTPADTQYRQLTQVKPLDSAPSSDPPVKRYFFDTGNLGAPVARIECMAGSNPFYCKANVYSGKNPDDMNLAVSGSLYQYQREASERSQMHVDFPESPDRYLCVEIIPEKNQTLDFTGFQFLGVVSWVFFQAEPEKSYSVFYGDNPNAPGGDKLTSTNEIMNPVPERRCSLGPEKPNPSFQLREREQVEPWMPFTMWMVLIAGVGMLVVLLLRRVLG